jgi:heme A synthase
MRPLRFARGRAWRFAIAVGPVLLAGWALMGLKSVRSAREYTIVAVICVIFQAVAGFTSWYLAAQRIGVEND